ncbi:FkbM family methyltransferase [Eoetvoesiella caeni]|uniref:FkbM family methyltransferase n=1 Tax=Eoetvoesiella caeni TaxID=645616 RepID=A0A366H6V3_9BURK|nr:FkbM family methyltransferase [Eoetvoesiella caeni]MCI2810078.1 FkbM family methyltransferase [Eoetvoesiella caeni]NYT55949.1 FkbM family methyltransferase [Eoetvoesiella caeni]RBP37438.1 FkbM family methyltransferase [Eoetvoesiella caeni]
MQTNTSAQLQAITTLYGHKMLVDPGSAIGREAVRKGIYDHPSIDLLRNILSVQRCRTVLDIGANIGNHSLAFSQLCARLLAFEPSTRAFEILKKNVDDNNLRNIRALNFGLSNKDRDACTDIKPAAAINVATGEAVVREALNTEATHVLDTDAFSANATQAAGKEALGAEAVNNEALGTAATEAGSKATWEDTKASIDSPQSEANVGQTDIGQPGAGSSLPVSEAADASNLKSGDAYLKSQLINDVDFIKIDAQGREQSVFEGLKSTLRQCRPLVLVEWSDKSSAGSWIMDKEITQTLFPNYQVFALVWNSNKHYWTSKRLGSLRRHLARIFTRRHKRLAQFDPVGHQTQVDSILLVPREKLPCVSQYVYR